MPRPKPHAATRSLLAHNFARLLVEKKTTVHAVATKAKVDRSSLYKVRRRQRTITVDILAHVADALGCEITEFFRK